ncbi:GNAT family N-acetyltransferase [Paenibacillus sp. N3/727]|uniref:GNAT family N-acetyltransferase n=1 Tax=Paenibacillus sp. N3/727 TaxID=2925845 RepID=UPI001F53A25B|nr:GNAT family N-acetyltransferase [Paenibacillus sp. N3/727]UNK16932.1 GNAT family N-acetyltransferase [Paenibacillus sp. N3/727]
MNHFKEITTSRLLLRELSLRDADSVFRHFSDPEVTRFMDIDPCEKLEEAEEIIQFHMDDSGCRYGLFIKSSGELAGTCGYHCWVKEVPSRAEIGFDLSSSYWGQGFMQEALVEILKLGFDDMQLDIIEATVEQDNIRSQKLLTKMNFTREDELRDGLYYYTLQK